MLGRRDKDSAIRLVYIKPVTGFILLKMMSQNLTGKIWFRGQYQWKRGWKSKIGQKENLKRHQSSTVLHWNWLIVIRCDLLWDRCFLWKGSSLCWSKPQKFRGYLLITLSIAGATRPPLKEICVAQFYVTQNIWYREHQLIYFSQQLHETLQIKGLKFRESIAHGHIGCSWWLVAPTSSTPFSASCTVQHKVLKTYKAFRKI